MTQTNPTTINQNTKTNLTYLQNTSDQTSKLHQTSTRNHIITKNKVSNQKELDPNLVHSIMVRIANSQELASFKGLRLKIQINSTKFTVATLKDRLTELLCLSTSKQEIILDGKRHLEDRNSLFFCKIGTRAIIE